jgi:ribosomal protein S18 acetylase RimI-like enzyme
MENTASSRPRDPQPTRLTPAEWKKLRAARLKALQESGDKFISNFEREAAYNESHWVAEFKRGHWWILESEDIRPADGDGSDDTQGYTIKGLIGATRELDRAANRWYLEYIWVDPALRRKGFAGTLIRRAVAYLSAAREEASVSLWVLDGNHAARNLYGQLGFKDEGTMQPLNDNSGRKEVLMELRGSIQSGAASPR